MKSAVKHLYTLLSLMVIFVLYTNCAPSFQASGNSANVLGNRDGLSSGSAVSTVNSTVVLDKARFRSLMNSESNKVNLSCLDSATESVAKYPSLLMKVEVANGLKDILGINANLSGYPVHLKIDGFEESNELTLTDSFIQTIEAVAQRVAVQFNSSIKNKSNEVWSCDSQTACLDIVINDVVKYLWRRPLIASETALLKQIANIYDSNEEKIIEVLTFALSAPQFYVRNHSKKSAINGKLVDLFTQAESMAFILGSTFTPKDLFDKIEAKTILSHEDIFGYAKSYLNKGEVMERAVDNFFGVWLDFKPYLESGIDFDGQKISELAQDQKQRIYNLVKNDQPITSIIKDENSGYIDSKLFAYLTFNSADDSWPIYRGLRVLGDLMCFDMATNELNAATEEQIAEVLASDEFPTEGNNLEKMDFHSKNVACNICHQYIDPAAIGLEVFDAYGNIRDTYPNGDPIKFEETNFAGKNYSSYDQYAEILKETFDYKHCFATKLHHKIRSTASTARNNSCFMSQLFQGSDEPGLATLLLNTLKTDLVRKENKPNYE